MCLLQRKTGVYWLVYFSIISLALHFKREKKIKKKYYTANYSKIIKRDEINNPNTHVLLTFLDYMEFNGQWSKHPLLT